MAKSRTKNKAKRGKSLKADIEEETMTTVPEDNNEDSGDESVEMSNKEYTKTPRKIQRTTTPATPKFTPKKKTVYRSEDSSSDEEGDDNTNNTSDDDTADSGGRRGRTRLQ